MRPNRLREWREKAGLSQKQVAVAVGLGKKSKSYISRLETGEGPPASALIALKIEKLSDGYVPAASLCPDLAELQPADPPGPGV